MRASKIVRKIRIEQLIGNPNCLWVISITHRRSDDRKGGCSSSSTLDNKNGYSVMCASGNCHSFVVCHRLSSAAPECEEDGVCLISRRTNAHNCLLQDRISAMQYTHRRISTPNLDIPVDQDFSQSYCSYNWPNPPTKSDNELTSGR